ncbi:MULTISPECIES: hypothetical protein [Stenotrophomonas maltophilia group]|uniref:hypothetical protein n=1 Tax=Stenotrophomonas maltophilia group TaxID=995085 RepID=UPI00130F7B39|nr:hypothetical protein [Stenotrophomonas maltophilia]EKU9957626.1 hypothetical protein [Stenotrophomonas maltophilia]EKU9984748.1 hypothetical protein [Stenotrophomonas maltophilia]HEL4234659.1 hypothetical protein [Stenotrophomonas maltophilia]
MNADAMKFDLHALAAPKSRADLIALASEVRAEFANIRARMADILANEQAKAAA